MGEKQGLTKFPSHPPCSFPKYEAACLISCQQRRQLICKLPRCYVSAEGCLCPGVGQKIPCRSLEGPDRRGSFCIQTPRRRRLGNSDSGLHRETLSQNIIKWIKRSIQTGRGFSVGSQTEKLDNFRGIVCATASTETGTQSGVNKTGCCSWNTVHGMQQLGNYAWRVQLSCILTQSHWGLTFFLVVNKWLLVALEISSLSLGGKREMPRFWHF